MTRVDGVSHFHNWTRSVKHIDKLYFFFGDALQQASKSDCFKNCLQYNLIQKEKINLSDLPLVAQIISQIVVDADWLIELIDSGKSCYNQ